MFIFPFVSLDLRDISGKILLQTMSEILLPKGWELLAERCYYWQASEDNGIEVKSHDLTHE